MNEMPFKMHKIIYFPENLKKNSGVILGTGRVGLPLTEVFFIWPHKKPVNPEENQGSDKTRGCACCIAYSTIETEFKKK